MLCNGELLHSIQAELQFVTVQDSIPVFEEPAY